ncbi:MAG TPA: hypothetical protein PLM14_09320 [Candidatus Hydrogenedentes bacterium]|nr:hypothetical protein [Candidatus Hydrogenedentota bacterium]HQE83187.1 hypothetical protein [Candidatus Hydrogenedentota bacterium]HQH50792.1 hypothetical protein [Candidatus Hydrogenedentota bacterium]HQM47730.1 hypothetical protein [Candidatus Hydrogenedentota bacterium]
MATGRYKADIYPQLELRDAPQRREPAYAHVSRGEGTLGNGFLELVIKLDPREPGHATMTNKLTGEQLHLSFSPFEAWFSSGPLSALEGQVSAMEARGSGDVSTLVTKLDCGWLQAQISYVLFRGEHFIRKNVAFHGLTQDAFLEKVTVIKHTVDPRYGCHVHDGGMYYPVMFLRSQRSSLFFCVDFPGYFVVCEGRDFTFEYYPGTKLTPGRSHQMLAAHIGVCSLEGRNCKNPFHDTAADLDIGEQQWFREYLLTGASLAELPSVELKGPEQGTAGPSDLEVLEQCRWLNATRVFLPRMLESLESYPLRETVEQQLQIEGLDQVLRIRRDRTENLGWVALDPLGAPATHDFAPCFASEAFCDSLVDRCLRIMDRYQFRNIEVSGSPIVQCHAAGHGHSAGIQSLMKAFQGLVEVVASLKENYAHVTCMRPYVSYGAGLARLCDALAVMSEEHPLPLPDIHPGRLFADMQRLYFRRAHSFLIPRSKLSNAVGMAPEAALGAPYPGAEHYPWYLYHDSAGWRYGLISALATTPRHRFHALPQDLPEGDRAFAVKWLAWERKYLADRLFVEEILAEPGLGEVDGYSYATAQGAVLFLFNTSYDPREVHLRLHLKHDLEYIVREIHPRKYNYLGPNDGLFTRDSELSCLLEPKEARIVEVVRRSPAAARRKRPEVFGVPHRTDNGNLYAQGQPGTTAKIVVRSEDRFSRQTVTFRGEAMSASIRDWLVTRRLFAEGVESLPQGDFEGVRLTTEMDIRRDVWLSAAFHVPESLKEDIDTLPFQLNRPCWAYPKRLFFVIRFEPEAAFDPIRTGSGVPGIPEGYASPLPPKCGLDLAGSNYGLRAWVNGVQRTVFPALASWRGYTPNPNPVVAYFFEAGSKLEFGKTNKVVVFANHFDPAAFKGITIEHLPEVTVEEAISLK